MQWCKNAVKHIVAEQKCVVPVKDMHNPATTVKGQFHYKRALLNTHQLYTNAHLWRKLNIMALTLSRNRVLVSSRNFQRCSVSHAGTILSFPWIFWLNRNIHIFGVASDGKSIQFRTLCDLQESELQNDLKIQKIYLKEILTIAR